jgi:outer membrane autotransporter protein
MTKILQSRLSLAALATASSLIALSAPAQAQSVCTATAGTIDCLPSVATVTYDTVGATVGGQIGGLRIVSTADQTVTGSGTIATDNGSTAVVLTSLADLTVAAGASGPLSAVATGTGNAFVLTSGDTLNAALGTGTSASGYALLGTATNDATVTTGALTAGGTGAASLASTSGDARLTVNGNVAATGLDTYGINVAAPAGDAVVVVNGNVSATGTGANAYGISATGLTSSSLTVGNVSVAGGSALGAALSSVTTGGTASLTCGNVSTTADGVGGVYAAGTDVVIRCGNVTTTGAAAPAVVGVATNSIDAQVGNLSTSGAASPGLVLTAPGPITATTGNIATTGAGSTGVLITGGTGAVTLNAGRVTATGDGSAGVVSSTTTGAQTLTVAGAATDLDGITATSTTGAITVNAAAPVTSARGTGIAVTIVTGPVTVNELGVTGLTGGVSAVATGIAPVTVNANGGLTTATGGDAIAIATLGTATTNVAAGATVSGQGTFDAIDTAGAAGNTVTNRGTISVAPGGTGYAIRATGGATTVNNLAGAGISGPLLLTAGADTVNNAGVISFTGVADFGAGADTLNNQLDGSLLLDKGATVNGLETLNNGGNVSAIGTTQLNGTTFNNLAGGSLTATGGAASLTGLTAFNNAGTIALSDGATNDTLTLPGTYTGSTGSRLTIDAAPGLNAADRLVIGGNIAGATQVDVNFVGTGPLYNPTGVLVVDGGGTAAANAFVINPANVQQGLLNYGIRQAGNDFFLASNLDASAGELALVSSAGPEMWYQSFDAYHDSIMGRQGNGGDNKFGFWANLYLSRDKYGDQTVTGTPFNGQSISYSPRIENHRRGAQGGFEYRSGMFTVGVTGGYEHNRPEFGLDSRMDIEGYNYGAYALFGMENGIYGGVMYKRDEYDIDFANNGRAFGFRSDAHSDGVDGELGLRFGTGIKFDLNGGVSYVKTDIDPYANYGLNFAFEDMTSVRGRLGARVIMEDWGGLFLGAKAFHEFRDNARVDVSNGALIGSLAAPERGTWVRVEAGVGASSKSGAQLTAWADLGDTKGIGVRAGFHF